MSFEPTGKGIPATAGKHEWKRVKFASIQRVIGALVAWSSLMMLPPALVSWFYR